jgi:hypothetical protein
MCHLDRALLISLGASDKQDDDTISINSEVDSIARSIMDSEFSDALSN